NTEMRRNVAYELAELSIKHESLWIPLVYFESNEEAVAELERESILVLDSKKVGFRHQTLLEYARARLFIKKNQSLCRHVYERQNAVHVRPTLWSVLTYLRDADFAKYELELAEMFNANLRLHIR